jgi:hypothetical protein
MIFYFPLFWTWVFIKLVIYRPKVVHAFDLDTVLPCYIYKKLFRKKLVFDIVDRYAITFYISPWNRQLPSENVSSGTSSNSTGLRSGATPAITAMLETPFASQGTLIAI